MDSVSQSLAGRTALRELLPLSLVEIRESPGAPGEMDTVLWSSGYPRIFEQKLDPSKWLASYPGTYLERDVRGVLKDRGVSPRYDDP